MGNTLGKFLDRIRPKKQRKNQIESSENIKSKRSSSDSSLNFFRKKSRSRVKEEAKTGRQNGRQQNKAENSDSGTRNLQLTEKEDSDKQERSPSELQSVSPSSCMSQKDDLNKRTAEVTSVKSSLEEDASQDDSKKVNEDATKSIQLAPNPVENITEEYVKMALCHDLGQEAHLQEFRIEDFTKPGDNYACKVTSVICTYQLHGELQSVTYIVKLLLRYMQGQTDEMMLEIFEREGFFLTKAKSIVNEVLVKVDEPELRVPECVLTVNEKLDSLIFTKDLRKENYVMADRKVGLDVPHATIVLRELARLHAAGYILKAGSEQGLLDMFPLLTDKWLCRDLPSNKTMNEFYSQLFKGTLRMLEGNDKYQLAFRVIDLVMDNAIGLWRESLQKGAEKFKTICHGDPWNNNFLFRYSDKKDPEDVVLVDLQLSRIASIATDLNYFLMVSTEVKMREKNLDHLLKEYLTQLESVLRKASVEIPFTFDELKEEYYSQNLYGFVSCQMLIPLVMKESCDVPDYTKLDPENVEEFMEEENRRIEKMMKNNPLFESRFLGVFDDCIRSGAFQSYIDSHSDKSGPS